MFASTSPYNIFFITYRWLTVLILLTISFVRASNASCLLNNDTIVFETSTSNSTTEFKACLQHYNLRIKHINIHCCVPVFEADMFMGLPSLSTLIIADAGVKSIPSNFISNIPSIEKILMPFNNIRVIPTRTFVNFSVTTIMLSMNDIYNINYGGFENLIIGELWLNLNKLTQIEQKWFRNTTISTLSLDRNHLFWLTNDSFGDIQGLTRLILSNNKLYYIDDGAFSQVNRLNLLDLSGNMLTHLNFLSDIYVNHINVENNQLTSIFLKSSVKTDMMGIYLNPWKCECLKKFWSKAKERNITINYIESNQSFEYPVCIVTEHTTCLERDITVDTIYNFWKKIVSIQMTLYRKVS